MITQKNKGHIFVLTAPSGAGKNTLIRHILAKDNELSYCISATTRQPRHGETKDQSYYYYSDEDFRRLVEEDCFVEYAKVHGHYYGTLKSEVQRIIDNNVDGIMDIDVQGAMTLQQKLPKASFIFILPPSLQALQDRLQKRGTEDPDKIKLRIKNSLEEVKSLQYFDYVVINDNIGQATNELYCIIKAERNKTKYFHSPF